MDDFLLRISDSSESTSTDNEDGPSTETTEATKKYDLISLVDPPNKIKELKYEKVPQFAILL